MLRRASQFVLLIILVGGLLFLGYSQQPGLYEARKKHGLTPADPHIEGRPELVLVTQALGGFRALLVDLLWLRAIRLQQNSKFWELVQLSDWICKLEPRLPEVWIFNAWNLAYNVLAEVQDSEDRWQWLWRGIQLVRDEGLEYNPNDPKIYRHIARLFWHKIGNYVDPHNIYYKHRLALMMHGILGGPDPDLESFAAAPRTKRELLKDDAVRELAAKYASLQVNPPDLIDYYIYIINSLDRLDQDALAFLDDTENANPLKKIDSFARASALRTEFKMEPELMVEQEEEFGKMDWRLPDPHGIYWGMRSVEASKGRKRTIDFDRMVLNALMTSFRRGKIVEMDDDPNGRFVIAPNFDLIPVVDETYTNMVEKYKKIDYDFGRSMGDGHKTFLNQVVRMLYFAGLREKATKYYLKLVDRYWGEHMARMTMEEWILGYVKVLVLESGTPQEINAMVHALLRQACYMTAVGQDTQATLLEGRARSIWNFILEEWERRDETEKSKDDATMQNFKEIRRHVVLAAVTGQFPEISPELRERLKHRLRLTEEDIQRYVEEFKQIRKARERPTEGAVR